MNIHALPDCFHSLKRKTWEQVIEEFGEETVRLALWPDFIEE
jgi:hypothetical protein